MADYQVTFTLQSQFTGTTQADNFTIIGKHANGSPSDTTIATNVTKAQLTAGVTYTVADTITGGTITSTGVCTNSVNWLGLNSPTPDPTATPRPTATAGETLYNYYLSTARLGDSGSAGLEFCQTNYTATTLVKSPSSTIPGMLGFMLYDSNGDPVTLAAGRYSFVSTVSGAGSADSLDPRYIIEVSLGTVEDVAQLDCTGGGGNPL